MEEECEICGEEEQFIPLTFMLDDMQVCEDCYDRSVVMVE